MQFTALPQSDHDLIILRPLTAEDIASWYAYLTIPTVFEHTSWNLSEPSELLRYVWLPEEFTPSSLLRFALALRSSGQLVGTAGFHTVSPENKSAELAYDLSPSVWGKGLATYACGLLTQWAHAHVGLVRVQATVLHSNLRSACVLQRCGFEHEGHLRSYRMVRGVPGNFNLYAHVEPPPPAI